MKAILILACGSTGIANHRYTASNLLILGTSYFLVASILLYFTRIEKLNSMLSIFSSIPHFTIQFFQFLEKQSVGSSLTGKSKVDNFRDLGKAKVCLLGSLEKSQKMIISSFTK